ncbi:hypothetical protein [Pseudomonas sp. Marseille-Q5115]|uniref:hypothetical protein n=1 Tax=Pseudomonas sp. Marseille-Q5115 TaxID=2866593 RepID=UPI001CE3E097|nr:hypothetical protein [Pseudomonas sp. Marseille-Q5115]
MYIRASLLATVLACSGTAFGADCNVDARLFQAAVSMRDKGITEAQAISYAPSVIKDPATRETMRAAIYAAYELYPTYGVEDITRLGKSLCEATQQQAQAQAPAPAPAAPNGPAAPPGVPSYMYDKASPLYVDLEPLKGIPEYAADNPSELVIGKWRCQNQKGTYHWTDTYKADGTFETVELEGDMRSARGTYTVSGKLLKTDRTEMTDKGVTEADTGKEWIYLYFASPDHRFNTMAKAYTDCTRES